MFDNNNPYTLRTEETEETTRYFASFDDGQGVLHEIEVSYAVYFELAHGFVRTERNLRRWDERYMEQSALTDKTLQKRAMRLSDNVEDTAFQNIHHALLWEAVGELPELQRRRFILYFIDGLTFEQIAERDRCTKMAVKYTVDKAKKAVIKKIENF